MESQTCASGLVPLDSSLVTQPDIESFEPIESVSGDGASASRANGDSADGDSADGGSSVRVRDAVGATVVKIELEGHRAVPERILQSAIATRVGEVFERAAVAADIRRLWRLEVLADVQVLMIPESDGVALTYRVAERPLIGDISVIVDGRARRPDNADRHWRRIWLMRGGVYEPWRLRRAADYALSRYRDDGHLRARARVATGPEFGPESDVGGELGRGVRSAGSAPMSVCFAAELGPKYQLQDIAFTGNQKLSDQTLRAELQNAEGKVNVRGGRYRPDWLVRDLVRVQALYYERGYLTAELGAPELELDDERSVARVVVKVEEGPQFRYGAIEIVGEPAGPRSGYRKLFAGRPGDVFVRSQVMAWIRELERRERTAGRESARVTPLTEVHRERQVVDLRIQIDGE